MRSIFLSRTAAMMAVIVSSALASASCASEFTRTGSTPSFLIVESLLGAAGAEPDEFGAPLYADVLDRIEQGGGCMPVIYNDLGQVRVRVSMRNPLSPTSPSAINSITIERYHIEFRRSDGRNTPGVDVPHAFDGAATFTIPADGTATFGFEVVRLQAKLEPPLRAMVNGGAAVFISTLAEITFYGRDQAGNEVSVKGSLGVNFGDFADEC